MRQPPPNNYLKYWRFVRYYIKNKYELSQIDLDVLMYLYDQRYFTNEDFEMYERILPFSNTRMKDLAERGWITKLPSNNKTGRKNVYEITYRAQRVMSSIYKILDQTHYPTGRCRMTRTKKRYMDRQYMKVIKDMINEIRDKREKEKSEELEAIKIRERDARVAALRGQPRHPSLG